MENNNITNSIVGHTHPQRKDHELSSYGISERIKVLNNNNNNNNNNLRILRHIQNYGSKPSKLNMNNYLRSFLCFYIDKIKYKDDNNKTQTKINLGTYKIISEII